MLTCLPGAGSQRRALAFVSAAVMSFTPASSPAATSLVPSGLYATARTGRVNLVATPHSSSPGSLYSYVEATESGTSRPFPCIDQGSSSRRTFT